jgi:predicted RND superfamily exporter protein
MPVAVLSSLTLGLAVDFAIHFLARAREQVERCGSWERAFGNVFGAPARAIVRNVVVIVVGFTPLLVAPLMPYQTVGLFLAAIMAVSGIGTLIILPALVRLFQRQLFRTKEQSGVLQAAK